MAGKWTTKERQEILSKPFEIVPEPSENMIKLGMGRGLLPWQFPFFMYLKSREERERAEDGCHLHNITYDLAFGSAGPGKSLLGTALALWYMITFPGCEIAVGANKYKDVEKNIIYKYFMPLLSVKKAWDHPWVTKVPNQNNKTLQLTIEVSPGVFKTSICHFLHFEDHERLRGLDLAFVFADEISQLKDSKPVEELSRRLRATKTPCCQLYCTTNPPESLSHWLYDKWDLTDHMKNYEGEKPKPRVCTCQFCEKCLDSYLGEFEWDENDTCTNPDCGNIDIIRKINKTRPADQQLVEVRATKTLYNYPGSKHPEYCPGSQHIWRVITASAKDNYALPSSYIQSVKSGHDDATFDLYMKGEPDSLGSNKAYNYSLANDINNIEIDHDKDIHWSFDFNNVPQASVIVQLEKRLIRDKEEICPVVVDEIVLYKHWDSRKRIWARGARNIDVAQKFVEKYKGWNDRGERKRWVFLHGDSTAVTNAKNGVGSPTDYQIISDILIENGFNVLCTLKKGVKGVQNPPEIKRVATVNWMLCDHEGNRRLLICKRAEALRKSLTDMELDKSTNRLKKKALDDAVAAHTNMDYNHLQSHVSDALGYLIVRKWDLVKNPNGSNTYVYIPGFSLLNIDSDNPSKTELTLVERKPTQEDKVAEALKDCIPIDQLEAKEGSILEYLRNKLNDEDDHNGFLSYFSQW